jgi:hypothetical protein
MAKTATVTSTSTVVRPQATAVPTQEVFLLKYEGGYDPSTYLYLYVLDGNALTFYHTDPNVGALFAFSGTSIIVASGPQAGWIWAQDVGKNDFEFNSPARIASLGSGINVGVCHISSGVISCSIGSENQFRDCYGSIDLASSPQDGCYVPIITAVEVP